MPYQQERARYTCIPSDHESWIQITAFFSASSLLFASLLIRREWIHHTSVFPVLCSKLSYSFQRVGGGDGSCENVASDVMLDVLSSKRPGFLWGCRVIGPPRAGFESSVACLSVRLLYGSAQEVSCCGYWCLVYVRVSLSLTLLRRDGMRFLEKSWWCWIAGDDVVHVCEPDQTFVIIEHERGRRSALSKLLRHSRLVHTRSPVFVHTYNPTAGAIHPRRVVLLRVLPLHPKLPFLFFGPLICGYNLPRW